MKTSAIIAEYNPFHNGHKYQIDKIKKQIDTNIVVIMSSNFTQRGTPAILNKYKRAEIAVENGANLVIELPIIYSSSNAEIFSKGAINILNSLNIIDYLYFGSEDTLEDLVNISKKIKENENYSNDLIKKYLKEGYSYLISRELSYDFLNKNEIEILKKPNNILALEYIKSLDYFNSNILPKNIIRHKVDHNTDEILEEFSSASNIRNLIFENNINKIKSLVPTETFKEIKLNNINDFNNYFEIFKYLVLSNSINYNDYFDYEEGLNNRFLKFIYADNIFDFINLVSTKRYTKSRISRLINNIILDINKDLIKESFYTSYIRILAMDKNGANIVKKIKNANEDIFIINKFSSVNTSKDLILKNIAQKELEASNIYNMYSNKIINEDYFKSPYYKKELRG